jgi:hypothetical protein
VETAVIRPFAGALAVFLALGPASSMAQNGMKIVGPDKLVASASSADSGGNSTLTWNTLTGPAQSDLDTLTAAFPGWTFAAAGQLNGVVDIADFEATATATKGGAALNGGYTVGQGDPALKDLHWIQMLGMGDYRARVTYEDGEDETYLKCVSNWAYFRITPRTTNSPRK